jgi:[acyl-carrier-protein] S-malonyltransferase
MNLDSKHLAFLFPGQGSQCVGMGRELASRFEAARLTFEEANEILGLDLARLMWDGPEGELNDTLNTQPALYVHSIAAHRVLSRLFPDLRPVFCAGHSLGELSALTVAGALPFEAGLRLVRQRGELMKRAGELAPGGMAAIMGLDIQTLETVCVQASTSDESVQVANDNCPGQIVLSGARPAMERALGLAKAAGARRAVLLAVSIAAHSPLMASIQADFEAAVDGTFIVDARLPVISNITAQPIIKAEDLRADLSAQLTSRVRWTESMRWLVDEGVEIFIEVGNGSVLTSLLKRIAVQTTTYPCGSPADLQSLTTVHPQ